MKKLCLIGQKNNITRSSQHQLYLGEVRPRYFLLLHAPKAQVSRRVLVDVSWLPWRGGVPSFWCSMEVIQLPKSILLSGVRMFKKKSFEIFLLDLLPLSKQIPQILEHSSLRISLNLCIYWLMKWPQTAPKLLPS